MKHGELYCYRFEDNVIRPGVVIKNNENLCIIPVCGESKTGVYPITHIPLTLDDGVVKEAFAICERMEAVDENRSIYRVSNLTNDTLHKISLIYESTIVDSKRNNFYN